MTEHYLAILLQKWLHGKYLNEWEDTPYLFSVLDDGRPLEDRERKFWHGPGPSYQTINWPHAKVEKDYGVVPYEIASVAHARDWPPTRYAYGEDVPRCPGWIAPNGDYYPCSSWGHNALAIHISLVLWGESKTRLEDYGWIAVKTEALGMPEIPITERQRTTLWAVWSSKWIIKPMFPEWQLRDELENRIKRAIAGLLI